MSVRRIYFLIVLLFVVILNIDIVAEFPPVRLYTSLWLIAVAHSGHTYDVAGMVRLHGGSIGLQAKMAPYVHQHPFILT